MSWLWINGSRISWINGSAAEVAWMSRNSHDKHKRFGCERRSLDKLQRRPGDALGPIKFSQVPSSVCLETMQSGGLESRI